MKTLKSICQNLHSCSAISQLHNHMYRKYIVSNPAIEFALNEAETIRRSHSQFTSPPQQNEEQVQPSPREKDGQLAKVQMAHPWVDLMEVLMKKGYFNETGNPIIAKKENKKELGKKDANLIRTACLNFARDHYQLIRYLSRKDILVIAGSGCPSTDRKVVNSAKRLRAHVRIEEGNVCSSCMLRGDCDRAYVKAREDEGGRTVDVMRILLTYCLDPILGSVENKPCLNKTIKESVRALVKEMVNIQVDEHDNEKPKAATSISENDIAQERDQRRAQMKQGDWICPKCNFLNYARNIKCLRCNDFNEERLKVLRAEQDRLPLKKGDWMCEKCNCLNFARNTKCYLCKANPPKRQLNPGEWQCESCNYINFRRNMLCLKCDHRRPIASNTASNGARHQETKPFLEQQKQNSYKRDDAIDFTEDASLDYSSSSTWNPDVMDIPIIGGKSKLSQNIGRQEQPGKLEMADRNRFGHLTTSDDDDGGDDDMAEWFREGKKL